MTHAIAYIGLGANLGDAAHTLNAAIHALANAPQTTVQRVSSMYGSAPVGEGADGPNYTNAVAMIDTHLSAHQLLDALQRIESDHGRERSHRNAARTLDLDILLYDDAILHDERLTVPHPRMIERAFVLLPLSEISPHLTWMNENEKKIILADVLPQVMGQEIVKL
ncbi:2-amino-4-hydroxy-6-hydroxymethyldihydropteridine pyrophosphokinase [Ephemeroptericola cinctiostellae]|uniref:2-amino-4-hydroxy-6-hydroxymethyldihydropteridine pyrophosphokinase n=1 Tax=Ephemeroptericola cinctiostellae TaxID=2268024 RepID=A0A345DBU1_9BURK|nr:2-amino-4-hydroxy-6-hydroxymethyldihydropteridine diphosphokinase [Ephemeroptericola cinctiostellae]AXF85829.1 2-amino-4-hydroxy-6-hydroxymethyldihydropteridine pyrophosphokinase [Ephemeroptericola cinctiostellae]